MPSLAAPSLPTVDLDAAAANLGKGAQGVGDIIQRNLAEVPDPALQAESQKQTAISSSDGEISYTDFLAALFMGDVTKVQFYGQAGEQAVATTTQGKRLFVQGVPLEDKSSSNSPLKLVAKVRDAQVPFVFESFNLKAYKTNGVAGLNARTKAAQVKNEEDAKEYAEFAAKRRAQAQPDKPLDCTAYGGSGDQCAEVEQAIGGREGFSGPGRSKVGDVQF
eukprot:FR743842.1.p1 GENE.FR743842.1~~FR743842.1.p1  ORF type:complete len:252 (+),score=31.10 FR743842.1:98-757(+)